MSNCSECYCVSTLTVMATCRLGQRQERDRDRVRDRNKDRHLDRDGSLNAAIVESKTGNWK